MNPFFFRDPETDLQKANEAFDNERLCHRMPEEQRTAFLLGWVKFSYKMIFEYMMEKQKEKNESTGH